MGVTFDPARDQLLIADDLSNTVWRLAREQSPDAVDVVPPEPAVEPAPPASADDAGEETNTTAVP